MRKNQCFKNRTGGRTSVTSDSRVNNHIISYNPLYVRDIQKALKIKNNTNA
jgi:hypothetical protein